MDLPRHKILGITVDSAAAGYGCTYAEAGRLRQDMSSLVAVSA